MAMAVEIICIFTHFEGQAKDTKDTHEKSITEGRGKYEWMSIIGVYVRSKLLIRTMSVRVCVTVIMGFCVEELSTSFIVFYGSPTIFFWVTLPFYYAFRKECVDEEQREGK